MQLFDTCVHTARDAETLEDVTYLCSERADFMNLGVDEERTDILWAALQVSSTDSQLTVN